MISIPQEYDALAIPGGFHSYGYDEAYDVKVLNLVESIYNRRGNYRHHVCWNITGSQKAGLLRGEKGYYLSIEQES